MEWIKIVNKKITQNFAAVTTQEKIIESINKYLKLNLKVIQMHLWFIRNYVDLFKNLVKNI